MQTEVDLTCEKSLVLEKAQKASQAIKIVDSKLHEFWNLILAEKRLYIVKDLDNGDREEKGTKRF